MAAPGGGIGRTLAESAGVPDGMRQRRRSVMGKRLSLWDLREERILLQFDDFGGVMVGVIPTSGPADLSDIDAPLAFCSAEGRVVSWTNPAGRLLQELGLLSTLPGVLPRSLWAELEKAPVGEALEWRVPNHTGMLLGCTRYRARGGYLLIFKEVSSQRAALSKLLQRQRLEVTGRLVASIAHELRNSSASIIYNAQLVRLMVLRGTPAEAEAAAASIQTAAGHLDSTVRGLLDYAKAAPLNVGRVNLEGVVNRAAGFLRSVFREGAHQVEFHAEPGALWVRGNTIAVEQVLVNLMLNAAQAADAVSERVTVSIRCSQQRRRGAEPDEPPMVRAQVLDDGPGIPPHLRELIFQPFFSTSPEGTGLGLPNAAETLERLGGSIMLEPSERGACFSVYFPLAPHHAESP